MPSSLYRRDRLTERQWYKIVIHADDFCKSKLPWQQANLNLSWNNDEAILKIAVNDAVKLCEGDVMVRNGGRWQVLMVSNDEDVVWLMMKLGLNSKDMRGKGDWAGKKYSCAAKNRIAA